MTKEKLFDHLKRTEFNIQSAKASIVVVDLVYRAYAQSDKVHKIPYGPVFCYFDNSAFSQIINVNDENTVAKRIYIDYLKNPKSLEQRVKRHNALTRQLDAFWRQYKRKKPEVYTQKQILKLYRELAKISNEWWYYGVIGEDKGRVIDLEIVPKFENHFHISTSEAREIINTLSHPDHEAVFNLERKDFLNICLIILGNKKLAQLLNDKKFSELLKNTRVGAAIKNYQKKNFWFKTDFYGMKEITPEVVFREVHDEIKNHSKQEISQTIKSINENVKKIRSQKKKIAKKYTFSIEDKKDLYFAKETVKWIDGRKEGMMKQMYYFFSFINDVAQRAGVNYHELSCYMVDELEQFIESGKRLSPIEIGRRNKPIFFAFEKGCRGKIYYNNDAVKMFEIAGRVEGGQVKGVVASLGKEKIYSGIARIVLDPSQTNFKDGEILVTTMTRVEYVPLMRRAKAIVTNEGGLACHAAIVSRELGIPAVIGTKNATKVIKDGDQIKINIQTGEVIIK